MVYVGVIGHMVQWFPDRRGFATGIVAAGYGMGALFITFPIAELLKDAGYQQALVRYGLFFIAVGVLAAQGLRSANPKTQIPKPKSQNESRIPSPESRQVRPADMLRTPIF